jgi:RNA polymerase sigma factor (TIGR02999 family)
MPELRMNPADSGRAMFFLEHTRNWYTDPVNEPGPEFPLDSDLSLAAAGDLDALSRVMPLVYARAREVAAALLAGDRAARWVRASSLVHRAFVRLVQRPDVDFADQARVTAVLTTIMRRLVIDIARHELAQARGGGHTRISLYAAESDAADDSDAGRIDALDMESSLLALQAVDPEAARVAELRLWGGMEFEQIAIAMDVPFSRVRRRWNLAKAWLTRDLVGAQTQHDHQGVRDER